jgi:hypothetical protein
MGPQEIQVGILKRLRGTPIGRHDAEFGMVYGAQPPYELLKNNLLDFRTMQKLRRFARFWDLVGNSGNFVETTPLFWSRGRQPFWAFWDWSEWLYGRVRRTEGIALVRLMELVFVYLVEEAELGREDVAGALWRDYRRGGRRDKPGFLREYLGESGGEPGWQKGAETTLPKRQARRLAHGPDALPGRDAGV